MPLPAFLQRLFDPLPPVANAASVPSPVAGGRRVYHEYFIEPPAADGLIPWSARVYCADGSIRQTAARAESTDQATRHAQAWCEATKKEALKWH